MRNKKVIALVVCFLFMFNIVAISGAASVQAAGSAGSSGGINSEMSFSELKATVTKLLTKVAESKSEKKDYLYSALKAGVTGEGDAIGGFITIATGMINDMYDEKSTSYNKKFIVYMDNEGISDDDLKTSLELIKLFNIFTIEDRITMVNQMENGEIPANLNQDEERLVKKLNEKLPELEKALKSFNTEFDLSMYAFVLTTLQSKSQTPVITDAAEGNIKVVIPDKIGKMAKAEFINTVDTALKGINVRGFEYTSFTEMTDEFEKAVNDKLTTEQKQTLKNILANYNLYDQNKTKPVITLDKGTDKVYLEKTEPAPDSDISYNVLNGYTAVDVFGQDITEDVYCTVNGEKVKYVNTSKVRKNIVEYNVEDSLGNKAETVTRTVYVLAPVELGTPVKVVEGMPVMIEGGTTLEGLPAGITITVNTPAANEAVVPSGIAPAGKPLKFDIKLTDEQKKKGVVIRIPTTNKDAVLSYFNTERQKWEVQEKSEVITVDGKLYVEARVHHFSIYGPLAKSAQLMADSIAEIANPAKNAESLKLPSFAGFKVEVIESSNESVIENGTAGKVIPQSSEQTVTFKIKVTNENKQGETATTPEFTVVVPAKSSSGGGGSGGSGGGGGGGSASVDTSKTQEIGAYNGGSFTHGNATVNFLTNAFDFADNIKVTIKKLTSTSSLPHAANQKFVSDVVEITKDVKGDFKKPVTVSLKYDNNKVDLTKSDVAIYWLNETTKKWVKLDNVKVDTDKNVVSGEVTHFTKFAVIATSNEIPIAIELTDIKGHWAEKDIKALVELGAIGGYADKTFKPDNKITRAEFAKILVKAYKIDNKNGKVFADTQNHWAKNDIAAAESNGIVSGYSATKFGPDDVITREQMAAMVVNAASLQNVKGELNFTDKAKISAWAVDVVGAATASKIVGGYPDNTFGPQNNATRAEAASVIMRALTK
ncbi:S-layer homology domain-containing protein [Desulfonispora thiosulfatigenes DSM 11270]|uniref:S-layer homology domain-containing protein n=1 Tax=Desulfonispora thiosulfatigenes DSM 11270 TaxID=656914 RepID=A0A1W1V6F2_DESTI|nr:S-layer homology domain-containing protein [Desulfonispora thiosulfatigenes]SMB88958.1 S-layer homology domain-containing protein [Desulfonispora thiosulfatigenes DSM 11270]